MVEDWRLDIFCRTPYAITGVEVRPIEPGTALEAKWKHSITLVMMPSFKCVGAYMLTVAWFRPERKRKQCLVLFGVHQLFDTEYKPII